MDHMKNRCAEEIECIRKGVNRIDGYSTTISPHYLNDRLKNDEYPDRIFDELNTSEISRDSPLWYCK